MSKIETGGPAFPIPGLHHDESFNGMTLREYAAITMRVPQSGTDWLDDMIREARRMDAAEKAMAAFMVASIDHRTHAKLDEKAAKRAYEIADAMLAAQEKAE